MPGLRVFASPQPAVHEGKSIHKSIFRQEDSDRLFLKNDGFLKKIPYGISVLENRTPDRKVLGKATEKLRTISEGQLRLISSLSERISAHNDTAGADIAFSLLTAMIVLS